MPAAAAFCALAAAALARPRAPLPALGVDRTPLGWPAPRTGRRAARRPPLLAPRGGAALPRTPLPAAAASRPAGKPSSPGSRAEKLPASPALRALRLAGPIAAVAVAALQVSKGRAGAVLTVAVALQCASVAAAAQAAAKGSAAAQRNTLLWLHAALAAVSLGLMAAVAAPALAALAASGASLRPAGAAVLLAALFALWANVNGSVSLADPRLYPGLLRRYLTHLGGSVPKGKGIFIKYHRTTGLIAYTLATVAACLALGGSGGRVGPAALAFAAAAVLLPSATRRRFAVPGVSVANGWVSVTL